MFPAWNITIWWSTYQKVWILAFSSMLDWMHTEECYCSSMCLCSLGVMLRGFATWWPGDMPLALHYKAMVGPGDPLMSPPHKPKAKDCLDQRPWLACAGWEPSGDVPLDPQCNAERVCPMEGQVTHWSCPPPHPIQNIFPWNNSSYM